MINASCLVRINPGHVYDMRTLRRAIQRMMDAKQQEMAEIQARKEKLEKELLFERGYLQALIDQEAGCLREQEETA